MQKGLANVVSEVLHHVEHRFCARHIYANWSVVRVTNAPVASNQGTINLLVRSHPWETNATMQGKAGGSHHNSHLNLKIPRSSVYNVSLDNLLRWL
ncbi:hypothetical protein K1719_029323 [Acacia pycnantha]|nr:hypothetical protein K1719_029323 [Acacia pycnantha]